MPLGCNITDRARKPSVLCCSKTETHTVSAGVRAHGRATAHVPHAACECVGGTPARGQPGITVTNYNRATSISESRSTTSARGCSAWTLCRQYSTGTCPRCTTEANLALPTWRLRYLSSQYSGTHKPRTGIHQRYDPNCPSPNRPYMARPPRGFQRRLLTLHYATQNGGGTQLHSSSTAWRMQRQVRERSGARGTGAHRAEVVELLDGKAAVGRGQHGERRGGVREVLHCPRLLQSMPVCQPEAELEVA